MRRGWRHWALRAGLLLASVAVVLLVLELVLGRHTPSGGGEFLDRAPDDIEVPWVLKPGTDAVFEGQYVKIPATRVRISEQGIRADETYAIPKPANVDRDQFGRPLTLKARVGRQPLAAVLDGQRGKPCIGDVAPGDSRKAHRSGRPHSGCDTSA